MASHFSRLNDASARGLTHSEEDEEDEEEEEEEEERGPCLVRMLFAVVVASKKCESVKSRLIRPKLTKTRMKQQDDFSSGLQP
jgi:hypothetical protein